MGTISSTKKIFQLDALSLVLACVISLLFTKGVVEFLNNTSKKQDHHASAFYSPQNDFDEEQFKSLGRHTLSPVENNTIEKHNFVAIFQEFRTIRVSAAAGAEVENQIFQPVNWYLDQSYKNTLPSRWGPTVSIAHCKLVI